MTLFGSRNRKAIRGLLVTCILRMRSVAVQELCLSKITPLFEGPGFPGSLNERYLPDPTRQEYLDTCRQQFGLSLRKAVSRLPRMTSLIMEYINVQEPGLDCAASHPWTHLR